MSRIKAFSLSKIFPGRDPNHKNARILPAPASAATVSSHPKLLDISDQLLADRDASKHLVVNGEVTGTPFMNNNNKTENYIFQIFNGVPDMPSHSDALDEAGPDGGRAHPSSPLVDQIISQVSRSEWPKSKQELPRLENIRPEDMKNVHTPNAPASSSTGRHDPVASSSKVLLEAVLNHENEPTENETRELAQQQRNTIDWSHHARHSSSQSHANSKGVLRKRSQDSFCEVNAPGISYILRLRDADDKCRAGKKTYSYTEEMMHKLLPLPRNTADHIRAYMSNRLPFDRERFVIPLWEPSPNLSLPLIQRRRHLSIGDVGVFTSEGKFDVMFNIFMTMNDNMERIMQYKSTPEGFLPFHTEFIADKHEESCDVRDAFYANSQYFTRCPEDVSGDCIFSCKSHGKPSASGGSILVAPDGLRRHALSSTARVELIAYLHHQVERWYTYLNQSRSDSNQIPNGALKLVNCCYKAKTWASAAISGKNSKGGHTYAKLRRSEAGGKVYAWEAHESIRTNDGSSKVGLQRDVQAGETFTIALEVLSLYRGRPPTGTFDSLEFDVGAVSTPSLARRFGASKLYSSWAAFAR